MHPADEVDEDDDELVVLVNKWVEQHCMGIMTLDVNRCAPPEEEYASRERVQEHVEDMMDSFKAACCGPQQPQVAIVWLKDDEEAFDLDAEWVMGDNGHMRHPRLTDAWLDGHGRPQDADITTRMIKGDHTSEAMRCLSNLYASKRWKTLETKILPMHRTQDNEDMAQGFGDLDNIKNLALERSQWSHLCRVKKEYDLLERLSIQEYGLKVKNNTNRNFIKRMNRRKQLMLVTNKISMGTLSSMWSMVSHSQEVWVQIQRIFKKEVVDSKSFKVPNTVSIFNQMGSIDDDFIVACLTKVVHRKEKLTPWFKIKCIEWKNKRRLKQEVLALMSALDAYAEFTKVEDWPLFCKAIDDIFDEKWLDTWAFEMRNSKITPTKAMPHKFQTTVKQRLDKHERMLKKKDQAALMVKILFLFVVVPFCLICRIAGCFFRFVSFSFRNAAVARNVHVHISPLAVKS